MKQNTRKSLLRTSCIATIILAILVAAAYFIIPVFVDMFSSFGDDLPSITQFVIITYKYWLIIPIISLAICIDIWRRSEYTEKYRKFVSYTLRGFIVGTIFLVFFVSIFAMYAPVFSMGSVVGDSHGFATSWPWSNTHHLSSEPFNTGDIRASSEPLNRENYAHFEDNTIKRVIEHPVSTFSIDVDTGAYSNVRHKLNNGQLPPRDAVRVEEFINYFSYNYPLPDNTEPPFRVTTEIAPTPWNQNTYLLHIGIKGFDIPTQNRPPANLVFLIDVSGSMASKDKLDLVKSALKLLSKQLKEQDRISMVVYAGASGLVLEPTPGNQSAIITTALARLSAGGSTNGGSGIQLAYLVAQQAFIKEGINRVILATDGDFNVGTVNFEALKNLIEAKRKTSISLTTLGFGTGNYNDHLMEQLADAGNGNYAYIDTLKEAQKVLVTEMSSTLNTIAKDVKIQIEFNPAMVAEYRLIGYENRLLKREDFSNDKVDAGEIGAGHTVTALYELALVGGKGQRLESLRYTEPTMKTSVMSDELVFLRLRYKTPDSDTSQLMELPLTQQNLLTEIDKTSTRFRFSAAVAAFGQLLRGGTYTNKFTYADVLALARGARGEDPFGYRGEFISLVVLTQSLDGM
jgi:Ca-activated chloride channel family protein